MKLEQKAELTEQQAGFAHLISGQQELGEKEECLEKRRDSLVVRLRTGSHAAAAELVEIYYERIYLFFRRLGHSRQESYDLTQESFLAAWQHIGRLRDAKCLDGWMYRIAGNVSKMYWRRHKGRGISSVEGIDVPDKSEAGFDKAEHYEQLGLLKIAVTQLPRKQRQVIVLHYMQQLSIAEAAEATGVREGTFKSRLNRALEALRRRLPESREAEQL